MSTAFSSATAHSAMRAACETVGLRSDDAQPMRMGENALYLLPSEDIVVRVARTLDYLPDVAREVSVSRWLRQAGLDAVEAVETLEQPVTAEGHPVTFWEYIRGEPAPYSRIGDLGALLHELHSLTPPRTLDLAEQNILDRVQPRVEKAPISDSDRTFLLSRLDELRGEVEQLDYPLEPCAIHGDAHIKNLMIRDGQAVLIDFERFAYGQPEWDIGMTATEWHTAGWWSSEQYRAFVDAYGFDITRWSGFPTIEAVHQLKMTTWIMQNIEESQDIAAEYEARMRTIRDGKPSIWAPR